MFHYAKKLTSVVCLMALCMTVSAAPAKADDHVATPVSVSDKTDDQLALEVAHAIRMYPRYGIFDWVEGTVRNGVVTLTGAVLEPYRKDDLARVVAAVPAIKEVHNELRVLPLSTFDDRIRRAAANVIYRDPFFTAYAIQANPPIHIVVENGNVTLKGVVGNPMDKEVAEMKVRTNVLAFGVSNELQIENHG